MLVRYRGESACSHVHKKRGLSQPGPGKGRLSESPLFAKEKWPRNPTTLQKLAFKKKVLPDLRLEQRLKMWTWKQAECVVSRLTALTLITILLTGLVVFAEFKNISYQSRLFE